MLEEVGGGGESYIRANGDDVFNPRISRGKTTYGVLVPDEEAFVGLHVRSSSDEILATISVHVDPVSHVVEVPVFVAGNGLSLSCLGHVVSVHRDDVQSSVALSRYEEAVRDHNGAAFVTEDIGRNDLDIVGPFEVADVLDLLRLEFTDGVVGDSIFNSRSDPNRPVADWASCE